MLKNKKGVSLMIAYTLLIIIAIALSIVVSSYLTQFLPSQRAECPSDINLIIERASCDAVAKKLSLTLSNRGLFTVPAMFVRLSEEGREVRAQVNEGDEVLPTPFTPNSPSLNFIYDLSGLIEVENGKNYILEIQAAILSKRILVPCENAIITDIIQCGEGGGDGKHNACVDNMCTIVDGEGIDACSNIGGQCDGGECLNPCEGIECGYSSKPECQGFICDNCPGNEICNPDEGECECIPKTCEELGFECGIHDDGCGNELICGKQGRNKGECQEGGICREGDFKCVVSCQDTGEDPEGLIGGTCEILYETGDKEYWDDYCSVNNPSYQVEGFRGTYVANQYKCEKDINGEETGRCVPTGQVLCLGEGGENPDRGVCFGDNIIENNMGYGFCTDWIT